MSRTRNLTKLQIRCLHLLPDDRWIEGTAFPLSAYEALRGRGYAARDQIPNLLFPLRQSINYWKRTERGTTYLKVRKQQIRNRQRKTRNA